MPNIPIRTCMGCGQKKPKVSLARFVYIPGRGICLDPNKRLPGRGGYVCPEVACLERAWKKKAFLRVLKLSPSRHGVMGQGTLDHLKEEMKSLDSKAGGRPKEGDLNEQA